MERLPSRFFFLCILAAGIYLPSDNFPNQPCVTLPLCVLQTQEPGMRHSVNSLGWSCGRMKSHTVVGWMSWGARGTYKRFFFFSVFFNWVIFFPPCHFRQRATDGFYQTVQTFVLSLNSMKTFFFFLTSIFQICFFFSSSLLQRSGVHSISVEQTSPSMGFQAATQVRLSRLK